MVIFAFATNQFYLLSPKTTTLVKNISHYDRIGRKKIGIYPGSFQHQ